MKAKSPIGISGKVKINRRNLAGRIRSVLRSHGVLGPTDFVPDYLHRLIIDQQNYNKLRDSITSLGIQPTGEGLRLFLQDQLFERAELRQQKARSVDLCVAAEDLHTRCMTLQARLKVYTERDLISTERIKDLVTQRMLLYTEAPGVKTLRRTLDSVKTLEAPDDWSTPLPSVAVDNAPIPEIPDSNLTPTKIGDGIGAFGG